MDAMRKRQCYRCGFIYYFLWEVDQPHDQAEGGCTDGNAKMGFKPSYIGFSFRHVT